MRASWVLLAAAVVGAGCASVLGLPDGTLSFCSQSANQGHAYCEDFDVGDPSTRWTFAEGTGGGAYAVAPGGESPPNLLDMSAPAQSGKTSALAGFDKEFDDSTFVGLHIEFDVRFVTPGGAPLTSTGGFLLIVDKSGGCIGIQASPAPDGGPGAGISAIVFQQPTSCSALTGGGPGTAAGPGIITQITAAPSPNTWAHVVVVVAPDPKGLPGAGTLTFNIEGQPSSPTAVPLVGGTLIAAGIPLVGFAAEVNGPGGAFEVQYDNITIDLQPD